MELRCSLCALAAIAAVVAVVATAQPAMAWTGDAGLEAPAEVLPGDNITVGVAFESSTWTEVKVTNVTLAFDWMPAGTYIYSKVVPVVVGPNGTYVFYFSVAVPEDVEPGTHQAEARVFASDAKEPSGWEIAYSQVYHVTIEIEDPDDTGDSICLIAMALPALAAIPALGVALIERRKY